MYKKKTILALIPARSGSVSIKDKNLQIVGEETILARSIRHAKNSELVDQVAVSTDGQKIKEEAAKHGAVVIDRPPKICGPNSSTEEAMLHAVEISPRHDYIMVLQPTSPFRSKGLIDRCIRKIIDEKGESLLTCWKFHNFTLIL